MVVFELGTVAEETVCAVQVVEEADDAKARVEFEVMEVVESTR